jgi:hypothetical protein
VSPLPPFLQSRSEAAHRTCQRCGHRDHRPIASYCKRCGASIPATPEANRGPDGLDEWPDLIGQHSFRDIVSSAVADAVGARQRGGASAPHLIILGDTGTGKTSLVRMLAAYFYRSGLTTKASPRVVRGSSFDEAMKDPAALFAAERGGMLFIDEAHRLVPPDGSSRPFDVILAQIEATGGDPIVVLAGRTKELRERIADHGEIGQRFIRARLVHPGPTLQP